MQTVKSLGVVSVAKTFAIIGAIFGVLAIPAGWITERISRASAASDISWQVYLNPYTS